MGQDQKKMAKSLSEQQVENQVQKLVSQNNSQDCPAFTDLSALPWANIVPVMKPLKNMAKQNVEAYVGGYVLRKAGIKVCEICRDQLIYSKPPNTELYQFLKNKAYKEDNTLVYPTEDFVCFIDDLEDVFIKVFWVGYAHTVGDNETV